MRSQTSSTSSLSWVTPFVLGAASSLAMYYVTQRLFSSNFKNKKRNVLEYDFENDKELTSLELHQHQQKDNENTSEETSIMDAPDLSHRILRKAEAVLQWRTTRLILIIERCTNDHNYSAILRTAEALGIQHVWMIDPPTKDKNETIKLSKEEQQTKNMHHLFAQNATEWLTLRDFATTPECVQQAQELGYELWVTDLSQEAVPLYMNNQTRQRMANNKKIALVMGTEAVGCSQYMLEHATIRVYLPLRGFADSLNLSVATALVVQFILLLDPTIIGAISEEEKYELRTIWFTKLCRQRLLSSKQKKQYTKLQQAIQHCTAIQHKKDAGAVLQPAEIEKLNSLPKHLEEVKEYEAILSKAQNAVQEWIDNPTELLGPPLTDVRRPDIHRVTFVGKNTKNSHKEHWQDMVATANLHSVPQATASTFRDKVKESEQDNNTSE